MGGLLNGKIALVTGVSNDGQYKRGLAKTLGVDLGRSLGGRWEAGTPRKNSRTRSR